MEFASTPFLYNSLGFTLFLISTLTSNLIFLIVAKWLQQYQASHLHPISSRERECVSPDKYWRKTRILFFQKSLENIFWFFFSPGWFMGPNPCGQENELGFSQSGPITRAKDEVVYSWDKWKTKILLLQESAMNTKNPKTANCCYA